MGCSVAPAISALILFCSLVFRRQVLADPNPTEPSGASVFNEGGLCSFSWEADTTGTWKVMNVELMTGPNAPMVHLRSTFRTRRMRFVLTSPQPLRPSMERTPTTRPSRTPVSPSNPTRKYTSTSSLPQRLRTSYGPPAGPSPTRTARRPSPPNKRPTPRARSSSTGPASSKIRASSIRRRRMETKSTEALGPPRR